MKTDYTIAAFHILGRDDPIQKGDSVLVDAQTEKAPILVMDVFREEFEETQKLYKKVRHVIERAPEE